MTLRNVIDIFNRDIRMIYRQSDKSYATKLILHSISFYTYELNLPPNHPQKIFTDNEYRLLIQLYQNELLNQSSGSSTSTNDRFNI